MPTKDETARFLADAHFMMDHGITRIFRIVETDESNDTRPVKLLEVNPMTIEAGIPPVGMTADPAHSVFYSSVVVEITPNEYERLIHGELELPHGWRLGPELLPRASVTGAA